MREPWKILLLVMCIFLMSHALGQQQAPNLQASAAPPNQSQDLQHLQTPVSVNPAQGPQQLQVSSATPGQGENAASAFAKFDYADSSSVYPSIGPNGLPEYSAERAVRKGSGYWCSQGDHKAEDVITWTGVLTNRRTVKGIEIQWAYSPGMVAVLASLDGVAPFQEVIPFQDVDSKEASFDQQLYFSSPVRAKAFQVAMKVPKHEYFGINLVQLITAGYPTIRIRSGVSSLSQDMCVQVDEQNEVVLDGCISAIAASDGRDMWMFNRQGQIVNLANNACIALKNNDVADGGTVDTEDCRVSFNRQDGSSKWELQPNNQMKILKGGNYCLSQLGSKSGSSDVALHKQAATSHANADAKHGPEMAIDGDGSTYWASQDFQPAATPESVYYDVNLGDKYKLKSIAIDWEYPAVDYSISISTDGESWSEVGGNIANSLHSTIDDLRSRIAHYIRIAMKRPHPTNAKVGDSLLYGIRTLSVYSNRLKSIVEDCNKAKKSVDARDKFFLEMVNEVDFTSGIRLQQANGNLKETLSVLAKMTSTIEDLYPEMVTCRDEKQQWQAKANKMHADLGDLRLQLSDMVESMSGIETRTSSTDEGYSQDFPLEDCYEIRNKNPHASSGFYYIRPPCSPKPLRAFCDLSLGSSYFVPPETDITQPSDSVRICASYGLKPFHLHNHVQLPSLHKMLRLMGVDLKKPVPIALDNGSGSFFDLGFERDVTKELHSTTSGLSSAAGIGEHGLVFFDPLSTEMSAIVCSTNKDSVVPPRHNVEVSCRTAVKDNLLFAGPVGMQVVVKCPENCIDVEADVIGTNVYADESSVCLAAIHAGIYDKTGLVQVTVANCPEEFDGKYQNGVRSDGFVGSESSRAFMVHPVANQCPSVIVATSFLEVNVIEQYANMGKGEQVVVGQPAGPVTPVAKLAAKTESYNSRTGDVIGDLLALINQQSTSVDASFIQSNQVTAGETVSKARSVLKPATLAEQDLKEQSEDLYTKNVNFTEYLQSVSQQVATKLNAAEETLRQALRERAAQSATDSWSLVPFNEYEFFDIFETKTSKSANGVGDWHMATSAIGGRETTTAIAQTALVAARDPSSAGSGTYLRLRHKRFFDGDFSSDVYMSGSGSTGVAFRMKDFANMYLFEMKQMNGGFKRLLRIDGGKTTEIARINDGGYLAGVWYTVRISMRQSRIQITVMDSSQGPIFVAPTPTIDVLDGVHVSGSIGFFSNAMEDTYWDNVKFKALPCIQKDSPPPPPRPPRCSSYRESFAGHFSTTWDAIEPDDSLQGRSDWKYANDIGGERKVIVQMSPITGAGADQEPTMALLKRHRSCEVGSFKFSFFPQCDAGIVGGVFKLRDSHNYMLFEMGPKFARLRRNIKGAFYTSATSFVAGYRLSAWNKVSITFNGGAVSVNAGNGTSLIPVFSVVGIEDVEGGTLGLASYNCPGVAFTNVTLHPLDQAAFSPKPFLPTPAVFLKTEKSGMDTCLTKQHIVERLEYCRSSSQESSPQYKRCQSNFCDSCCEAQFRNSAKARVTCKNHCHVGDHVGIQSGEALSLMQEACAVEPSNKLYKFCGKEGAGIHSCLMDLCSMCCQTAKIPAKFNQSFRAKALLVEECERQCTSNPTVSFQFEPKYTVLAA